MDSYFSREAQLSPSRIVSPTSASDISLIVKAMVGLCQNNSNPSVFTIRSGGHASFAGAANINNVVTIDLRDINNISDNPNQTITAGGGGSIWYNIYATLTPMSLTVLGARVAGRQLYRPSIHLYQKGRETWLLYYSRTFSDIGSGIGLFASQMLQ